jgi:hypothetical protein
VRNNKRVYCLFQSFTDSNETSELPLTDTNNWFYPSHGHESDEDILEPGARGGNWGKKMIKGARWARRGKIAAWGPAMEEAAVSALPH